MAISQKAVDLILQQHYFHPSEGSGIGLAAEHTTTNGTGIGVSSGITQIKNNNLDSLSIIQNGVKLDYFEVYDDMSNRTTPQTKFRTQEDRTSETPNLTSGPFYLSNTFFIVTTGTYIIRSLIDNVKIYLLPTSGSNSFQTTITTAYSSYTTGTLTAGDRIYANGPISISLNNTGEAGTIPAYAGWAGYTFATVMDRGTGVNLNMFTLDSDTTIEVYYSTTTSSSAYDTANLTRQNQYTITNANTLQTSAMVTTRYYYIVSNKPICVYRGVTQDKMPLFPMYPRESLYGFFSLVGHIQSTQSALSLTSGQPSGTVTNPNVKISASDNATSISKPNPGTPTAPYVYTDVAIPTSYLSGSNCTTRAIKVSPMVSTYYDISIAAEAQGDSAGTDMMPFVGSLAMGSCQILTVDLGYLACVAPEPGVFYVINSSNVVVDTVLLTGNATSGVYFGRTTTGLSAGNRFVFVDTNGDFANAQFFGDYNTTTREETVFYMVRGGEFKVNALTYTFLLEETCYETAANACSFGDTSSGIEIEITESSAAQFNKYTGVGLAVNDVTNYTGTSNCFYYITLNGNGYAVEIDGSGNITSVTAC